MGKIAEYRAALNQWAENTLPGGKIWSYDFIKPVDVCSAFHPLVITLPTFVTYLFGKNCYRTFKDPDLIEAAFTALNGLISGFTWYQIWAHGKSHYDEICMEIEAGNLPELVRIPGKQTQKVVAMCAYDLGRSDEYKEAAEYLKSLRG